MDDTKKRIESIIEKPLEDVVKEWEALDDASLTDEVVAYYEALADVTQRVEGAMGHQYRRGDGEVPSHALGDCHVASGSGEEAGDRQQQQQQQQMTKKKEGQVDDALGVEGVDFYEGSLDDVDPSEWQVPPHCIPIHTDVVRYDWRVSLMSS